MYYKCLVRYLTVRQPFRRALLSQMWVACSRCICTFYSFRKFYILHGKVFVMYNMYGFCKFSLCFTVDKYHRLESSIIVSPSCCISTCSVGDFGFQRGKSRSRCDKCSILWSVQAIMVRGCCLDHICLRNWSWG